MAVISSVDRIDPILFNHLTTEQSAGELFRYSSNWENSPFSSLRKGEKGIFFLQACKQILQDMSQNLTPQQRNGVLANARVLNQALEGNARAQDAACIFNQIFGPPLNQDGVSVGIESQKISLPVGVAVDQASAQFPPNDIPEPSGVKASADSALKAVDTLPAHPPASNNFLRRISQEHWDLVIERIRQHERPLSEEELTAFQKGNWEHPIFKDSNWTLFAFHAYLMNKIDEETMCKLFLYDACQNQVAADSGSTQNGIMACCFNYQLFKEPGVIDQKAANILRKDAQLTSIELKNLCKLLQDLPCDQTQFFVLTRKLDPLLLSVWGTGNSICVADPGDIHDGMEWTEQLVAPPSLMHLIYQVKFGKDAMRPLPHLGYAPVEDMSEPNVRIVSIPSLFPLPNVHDLQGSPLSIYHHDVGYHLILESANSHRPFWIHFAQCLQKYMELRNDIKPAFKEEILEYAWDREFERMYLKYASRSEPYRFWMSLLNFCEVVQKTTLGSLAPDDEERKKMQSIILDCFIEAYKSGSMINQNQLSMKSLRDSYVRFRELNRNPELEANDKKLKEQLYDYIAPRAAR